MSHNNVKRVAFVRDIYLPWEADITSVTAKTGRYISEIDLERPPSKTMVEIQFDPRTQQPFVLILKEKGGNRSVTIPISLTYQYCETSDITVPSPFQKH